MIEPLHHESAIDDKHNLLHLLTHITQGRGISAQAGHVIGGEARFVSLQSFVRRRPHVPLPVLTPDGCVT